MSFQSRFTRLIGKLGTTEAIFQECWAVSDTQQAFQQAIKERGYTLARGDRRGFVALDHRCEVFAVAKWVGIRAKEVRSKLSEPEALPSVDEAREQIAKDMAAHLGKLQQQQENAVTLRMTEIEEKRLTMATKHQRERLALEETQQQRWQDETKARQARFRKGLRGLLDRVTGKHRQIRERNEQEAYQAHQRDQQEKDALIFKQLDARRVLQGRIARLSQFHERSRLSLSQDRDQYEDIRKQQRETFEILEHRQKQRLPAGPSHER